MGRHIVDARVRDIEKRRMPSKHYVYVIHVSWTDGSITIIYRRYSKFFDFHMKLLTTFPDEAGAKIPSHRTIPFLPGKKVFGRSHTREVALKRMNQLDDYCKYLVKMPGKISNSEDVIGFFSPTPEDINPPTSPDPKSPSPSSAIDEISDPIQAEQYKVIADYKKQQKNEVNLETGDIVEVFEKNENGWWFVTVQDSQGWAPGTFLAKADGKEDEEESISGNDEKFITNNRYSADQEDELSFETGVVVKVLKKSLDGWWQAQYQDKVGWVPATYLQPYKGPDLVHTPATEIIGNVMSISNQTLTSSPNLGRKNQFQPKEGRGGGAAKRFNTEAKPTPPRRCTVKKSIVNNTRKERKRSQYRTTAAFTGHSESKDCITFDAEQLVEVLHKNEEWWFIKINEREGWAPASFIQTCDDSDIPPPPPPPSYPTKEASIDPNRGGSTISTDSETGAPRGPESNKYRHNIHNSHQSAFRPVVPSGKTEKEKPKRPPAPSHVKSRPKTEPSVDSNLNNAKKNLRPVSSPNRSPRDSPRTVPEENRHSIAEIRDKLNRTIGNQSGNTKPAYSKPKKKMYRTIGPYMDDEGISFGEGVLVELIEKDESGWWNVRIGSEEGWAPSTYLEAV